MNLLLAKLRVPQGESVRGSLFLTGIVAEGTDGYKVLYSLTEVDPVIHDGQVLVADTLDGKTSSLMELPRQVQFALTFLW